MSGKAPRQKGNRFERQIVDILRTAGLDAYRIPLSGSMRGFKQDIVIRAPGRNLTIEAKSRASGFAFIYKAIADADMLVVKVDRHEPLAVVRLADLVAIMGASETHKPASGHAIESPTDVQSHQTITDK